MATQAISRIVLIAAGAFGASLEVARVAKAVGRGIEHDGRFEADLCPIEDLTDGGHGGDVRGLLESLDFDARLRRARAVVLATRRLDHARPPSSVTFEIATRARQAGFATYAIAAHATLDPFEARIMDLQRIVEANSTGALSAAARELTLII